MNTDRCGHCGTRGCLTETLCWKCACAIAIDNGDMREAYALAHDAGVSGATLRRLIRDVREQAAKATLRAEFERALREQAAANEREGRVA